MLRQMEAWPYLPIYMIMFLKEEEIPFPNLPVGQFSL